MFPVIPNAKGKKDPDIYIYIYIYTQRPLNQPECDTN
jgi:hypothetical protein